MKLKHLYLCLAIIGFVAPYYFLVSFLTVHGLDGKAFVHQLFGTQVSTFFALDLLVSSIVFLIYLRQEARRYSIRHRWLYMIALLTVGLSFALPLFLCVREDRLRVSSSARDIK
jgi:NADH:ubiquinone oxidoreductase subunit 2 (subunit N)